MNKDELINNFINFGLSKNEAAVYLSSLSSGPASAQTIAKNANMRRTSVYPVIEGLKAKGIMKTEVHKLKKLFVAENPDTLRSMLPELNAIHSLKNGQSFIKYYEGAEGVKNVYNSILHGLKKGDEYLIVSDMERFLKIDRKYFENFIERRAKLNLKVRSLFQDTQDGQLYKSLERNTNQLIKLLPKNIDLTANMVILPTRLVITQLVEPIVCILIENKSLVEMHRQQFNIIWESLPSSPLP